MPANEVKVTVTPTLEHLQAKLAEARHDIANDATPWAQIATFLDRWVQQNFKSEGGKVGGWQAFSENNRRVLLDPSAKLLQDKGRLRASFLPFSSKSNAGIGSELPYAKAHNDGVGVPKRRILPDRGEVIKDAQDILEAHVGKVLSNLETGIS